MKVLLIFLFLLAACTAGQVPCVAQTNVPTPLPERTPDETFSSEIDHLAKLAGLPPLKSSKLARGDLDARLWYGFGLILLEGFAIKRTNNQWSAFHLKANEANPRYITKVARIQLRVPKSGWETCWQRLVESGILTLRSGTEDVDEDAEGFYVETMAGGSYRDFEFTSPESSKSPDAKLMLGIGDIISDEFGLARFHIARRSQ
jgi:hypothetical protein